MVTLVRTAAWLLAAAIVVVSLVPLDARPSMTADPSIERSLVYALLGLLMVLGYRRHWSSALLGCILLAAGLEVAQNLTGTRHGRVSDFVVKSSAAVAGIVFGLIPLLLAKGISLVRSSE